MSPVVVARKTWAVLASQGGVELMRMIRERGRPREYTVYRRDLSGSEVTTPRVAVGVRLGSLADLQKWRSQPGVTVTAPFLADVRSSWSDCAWARSGSEAIGVAWTTTASPLLSTVEGEAVIVDLYTVPTGRRHGTGTAVIAAVCRRLQERGFRAVYATVEVDNVASRRAFERNGFVVIGRFTTRGWFRRRPRTRYWAGSFGKRG